MIQHLLEPLPFAQCITALFLAILFLQSGLDKVFQFADNLAWLTGHFSKSPLRNQVKGMLIVVTMIEVAAGALALIGAGQVAFTHENTLALIGAQLAAVNITMLFFGQRLAKDYAGAAALVPYFLLSIAAIWLMSA